jgi:mono/diheme cytochrome c family protein
MALAMAAEPQSPIVTAGTTPGDVQRGRLLYETHCVACHTTQAHWRDKHLVKTQADLLYQVAKWQKTAGQSWSSEEIQDAAAYLNEAFYQMK